MNHALVKLGDGEVHLISPIGGGEYTLCGVAFDAADSESDESLRWSGGAVRGPVSCAMCATVVFACRGVRIVKATGSQP